MYELNRSYTPRKSFVQILLLPVPFRAFISPAICGSGCVQKHDRNCGRNICFGGSRKHLLSADSKDRARVTAHLMWPGDTCVSLTLRSTSKEGLFVLLYTWETWFPRGKGKLVGAVCLSSTALGTCWCDYPLHRQGLVHRQGMDGTLAVSGGVAWCWSLCWSVLDGDLLPLGVLTASAEWGVNVTEQHQSLWFCSELLPELWQSSEKCLEGFLNTVRL